MGKNIKPNLKTISDYLKLKGKAIFNIPKYQRAYTWQIENCDKLWQDIDNYDENYPKEESDENNYFFGTIIVSLKDGDTVLELIDGQQRTTTFLLLLKALLVKINDSLENATNDKDSVSLYRGLRNNRSKIMEILYKANKDYISDTPDLESDSEFYQRPINITNNSNSEEYSDDLKIILQSKNFNEAESKVYKNTRKQKDNRYSNFFRNYKYFYEKINELSDPKLNSIAKTILDYCELIEIRSWQFEQAINMFNSLNSAGMPLSDSDIISAQLYAAAEANGQEKDFSELWKELLNHIRDLKDNGIADLNSVMYQYMYYIRTISHEILSDSGAINVTTPGLRRYFMEINNAPLKDPIKMAEDLLRLIKAWQIISEYPLAQVLFKFNENAKLFLATYLLRANQEIVREDVEIIIKSMLKLFAVLELVDSGYSSKYFKTFLFGEEIKLAEANIDAKDIEKDFNEQIHKYWNAEDIADLIKDYNKNMLLYLNEYLFASDKNLDFNLDSKYDIEHIMPSSGKSLQLIREDAGIEDEEEFKNLVNKLGNKILLEQKINRSIGNEWFRTKVSTRLKDKTGYIDSSYPFAQSLVSDYRDTNKPYWKKEDILKATEKASERISNFIFSEN